MKLFRYEDIVKDTDRVTSIFGTYLHNEDRALISLQSFYSSGHVDVQSLGINVETAAALAKILLRIVQDGATTNLDDSKDEKEVNDEG